MAYTLEAIFGTRSVLHTVLENQVSIPAVLVPLHQAAAMVPMTDELYDAVTDGTSTPPLGFRKLPGGFDRVLAIWSSTGPIGYVEADYWGGVGRQRAVLWSEGHLMLGPLFLAEGQPLPAKGGPISQVLGWLGVDRTGHYDEFDAAGLREHRQTDNWLA